MAGAKQTDFVFRPAYADEYETVMGLVWKTFLRFEADEYHEEGVKNFQDFITNETLKKLYDTGQYPIFVAVYHNQIVGMISLRCRTHISLLFVDAAYHYRGVGRSLIQYACAYILNQLHDFKVTVNASPYAVGFYHRLGFVDTELEKETDGIRYTPMSLMLNKQAVIHGLTVCK